MRLFIAVPVPKELNDNIVEIQKKLKEANGDIKTVEKENLHFTIKFLGETYALEEIEKCMKKALDGLRRFDAEIAGVSTFPSKSRARVIWLSVGSGFEEFKKLMKNIDTKLSKIGFEREKDYIPHLTIARMRSERNNAELIRLLEKFEQIPIGRMRVKEVKLMKSTLTRTGPVYEEVYGVKLK
ncbi:MAG: RNA 2',3'-cyclic phosphodiesterase [Candidatus Aenigmatarchaeota archaeon]